MFAELHLVYTTDENFWFGTMVSALSAVARASDPQKLAIHVLDVGISDSSWDRFESRLGARCGALFRHKTSLDEYGKYRGWRGNWATYARLDIDRILPELDWCVSVDSDTLFVADPLLLREFYSPEKAIVGSRNHYEETDVPVVSAWHRERDLPFAVETDFCIGLVIMNLKAIRALDGFRKCRVLLDSHPDFPVLEQSAMNIAFCHSKALLPDAWGAFTQLMDPDTPKGCLHFATVAPWLRKRVSKIAWATAPWKIWVRFLRTECHLGLRDIPGMGFRDVIRNYIGSYYYLIKMSLSNRLPGKRGRYTQELNLVWRPSTIRNWEGKR